MAILKSLLALALALAPASVTATPLDDYVWKEDPNYGWVDTGMTIHGKNAHNVTFTGYLVNMTSQAWLTEEEVGNRHIWWHMLVIIVPSNLNAANKDNATMYITGWGNDCDKTECTADNWPKAQDEDIITAASLAMGTGTVTSSLFQVPNEHITFASDPIQKSRSEDAIIAFTWAHFLDDPSDPTWLVRFPMVKASVRAMDCVQEWLADKGPALGLEGYTASYFGVAGASKRGWTTWLVGAVDPERVMAIVPIVLDAINFVEFSHHQFKSYNGWSFALADYYDMGIMDRLDEPNMLLLQQMEDPYFYIDRLTMPKMIINAVGDEFQQPDDTHFWWSDMPEPKHWLMLPNAEHSCATGIFEAVPAIGTWLKYQLDKRAVPTMDWTIDNKADNGTGTIHVTLNTVPADISTLHVRKYFATTEKVPTNSRRDFRFLNLDDPCESKIFSDGTCINTKVLWSWVDLEPVPDTNGLEYVASHEMPPEGTFVAFMVDVRYDRDPLTGLDSCEPFKTGLPEVVPRDFAGCLEFTSEVSILPVAFPFADCVSITDPDTGISPCHSTVL